MAGSGNQIPAASFSHPNRNSKENPTYNKDAAVSRLLHQAALNYEEHRYNDAKITVAYYTNNFSDEKSFSFIKSELESYRAAFRAITIAKLRNSMAEYERADGNYYVAAADSYSGTTATGIKDYYGTVHGYPTDHKNHPTNFGATMQPMSDSLNYAAALLDSVETVASNGTTDDHHGRQGKGEKRKRECVHWTEEEHQQFLLGLEEFRRGDWKSISRFWVTSKTPLQIASHAQKYFLNQDKQRSNRDRIHDITSVDDETRARLTEIRNRINED